MMCCARETKPGNDEYLPTGNIVSLRNKRATTTITTTTTTTTIQRLQQ